MADPIWRPKFFENSMYSRILGNILFRLKFRSQNMKIQNGKSSVATKILNKFDEFANFYENR